MSGEPAPLRATGPTVEGDPITRGFQVTGQRTYDYVYDAREDSFGTKEVRLFHCEEFVGAVTDLQPSFAGARSCQPRDGQQLAGGPRKGATAIDGFVRRPPNVGREIGRAAGRERVCE